MTKKPVIGIVGGVRQETLDGLTDEEFSRSIETYRNACNELGAALARSGMRLLVWSSDSQFIERDVVEGYLAVENVGSDSIVCVWHKDHFPDFPRQDEDAGPLLSGLD